MTDRAMTATSLCIPLPPIGKARPRVTRRGTYMPEPYQRWRRMFGFHARAQWRQVPMEGAIRVAVKFITPTGFCRSDGDNALGSVLDALQGIAFLNDRQARAGSYCFSRGAEHRIIVEIEALAAEAPNDVTSVVRSKVGRNRPPQEEQ